MTLEHALPFADDRPHEGGNVLPSFAEWWQTDRKHVQTVVEIGPEFTLRYRPSQVLVSRSHDSDVDGVGLRRPDALERPFLKDPQ
jgi:hypothetical protein